MLLLSSCSPFQSGSGGGGTSPPADGGPDGGGEEAGAGVTTDAIGFGNGKDGALIVSNGALQINNVATRLVGGGGDVGARAIELDNAQGIGPDDVLLLVQITGAAPTAADVVLDGSSQSMAGTYELVRVAGVSANRVALIDGLQKGPYAPVATQVVRVPQYTDVTIQKSNSLDARRYDGGTGGIIAFLATGAVTLEGDISGDFAGFNGGASRSSGGFLTGCTGDDFVGLNPGYGAKGNGLALNGPLSGAPNVANAGGGGACNNAGGGGGGNGGRGGRGGRSCRMCDGDRTDPQGIGGAVVQFNPNARIIFGGGGGAGEADTEPGAAGSGGRGGGIVYVRAQSISGAGRIRSNGGVGGDTTTSGGGGGGAGGTIVVIANGACVTTSAHGGRGGNATDATGLGPGGGGGGGVVLRVGANGCASDVAGGLAGTGLEIRGSEAGGAGR